MARHLRPAMHDHVPVDRILRADPARDEYWRRRLGGHGAESTVGFSWRSHDLSGERFLACSALPEWRELLCVPGVRFVCLQYDVCEAELASLGAHRILRFPEIDMFDDLDETAALMSALDLVVSAPTTVSVLSAALGVPTWQLSQGADWQRLGRETHPWFGRLVRFTSAWGEPRERFLAQIAARLHSWAASRAEV
jgi:hypothetical protein